MRNKAARVGLLALFQNEVGYNSHGQIATSVVLRPSHMWTMQARLQYCLPHERYLKAVITKHSTGVKAKHMTHKASRITIAIYTSRTQQQSLTCFFCCCCCSHSRFQFHFQFPFQVCFISVSCFSICWQALVETMRKGCGNGAERLRKVCGNSVGTKLQGGI